MLAKFFSLVPMLSLLGCRDVAPDVTGPTEADVPTRFRALIGGFLGPTYLVELNNGGLDYAAITEQREVVRIIPSVEQWSAFRKSLEELKVWQWRTNYSNPNVKDGTDWSLEIQYSDRSNHIAGANSYPKAPGAPNRKPEFTKTFQKYLLTVQALIGGRDFK